MDNVSLDFSSFCKMVFYDECIFPVSVLANSENNRILGHKNAKRDSKTGTTMGETNSQEFYALQRCGGTILFQ